MQVPGLLCDSKEGERLPLGGPLGAVGWGHYKGLLWPGLSTVVAFLGVGRVRLWLKHRWVMAEL